MILEQAKMDLIDREFGYSENAASGSDNGRYGRAREQVIIHSARPS